MKQTAFRIPEELLDGLQQVQRRDGVGIAEQVRRAVRAWLDTKGIGAKKKTARRRVIARR